MCSYVCLCQHCRVNRVDLFRGLFLYESLGCSLLLADVEGKMPFVEMVKLVELYHGQGLNSNTNEPSLF